jgi:hypothetical protein
MSLSFTTAAGPRQRSHSRVQVRGTHGHILLSDSGLPESGGPGSPYLYPPGTGWPSYIPRHWVPFSSPPTTRSTVVEVFEPVSTGRTQLCLGQSQIQSQSYFTTEGLPPISSSWRQAL